MIRGVTALQERSEPEEPDAAANSSRTPGFSFGVRFRVFLCELLRVLRAKGMRHLQGTHNFCETPWVHAF